MIRRLLAAALTGVLALVLAAAVPTGAAAVVLTPLHILTVGDSITGAGPDHDSYRTELTRLLRAGGVEPTWTVAAISGSRTTYWSGQIGGLLSAHDPDVVITLLGTNDATATQADRDQLGTAVRVIQEAIRTHRGEVTPVRSITGQVQLSDPYNPGTPGWLPASEELVNGVIRDNLALYGAWTSLATVDMSRIPGNPTTVPDGVHPGTYGRRLYARLLYDAGAARGWWPASTEPPPCGLYGHPMGTPVPAYIPCPVPKPPPPRTY